MPPLPEPRPERPRLSIWRPDESESEPTSISPALPTGRRPSANTTLCELFEGWYLPLILIPRGRSVDTIRLIRESLALWRTITDDPPLHAIDDFVTASFVTGLQQQRGRKKGTSMKRVTVARHCLAIQTILDFSGPPTREGRDKKGRKNQGVLSVVPFIDSPLPEREAPHGDFTVEEIHAMYDAAAQMKHPHGLGVEPTAWWRALITTAFLTGLRIGELMRLEYGDLNPPEIQVWARNAKGGKGKRQYLAAEALEAIESIRTPRARIFQFPNWDSNPRWLQTQLKRLEEVAGIPPQRRFGFHGFRKLHLTTIAAQDHGGATPGAQVAQWSAGHDHQSTTEGHYINPIVSADATQRIVRASIDRFPSVTRNRAKAINPNQRRLFEE